MRIRSSSDVDIGEELWSDVSLDLWDFRVQYLKLKTEVLLSINPPQPAGPTGSMTITLYIGDVHGEFANFEEIAKCAIRLSPVQIDQIVQVGDFGFWPRQGVWYRKSTLPVPVRWIDGNHEDFDALESGSGFHEDFDAEHIPRGTVEGHVLYCGGAASIDKAWRTPGFDWFYQERINQRQVEAAIEALSEVDIRVMVAHDTTDKGYPHVLSPGKLRTADRSSEYALQVLIEAARPNLYIHGHHHLSREYEVERCRFRSLDMIPMGEMSLTSEMLELVTRDCCIVADDNGATYPLRN